MQLEEINSVDAYDITSGLEKFANQDWFFVRGEHQEAARKAIQLINKLNHNTTQALSEVERLCDVVDSLNDARYKEHKERSELVAKLANTEKEFSSQMESLSLAKTNYINLQKRFDTQTGALNRLNTALITSDEKYKTAVEEYKTLDAVNQELNNAIDNYDKTLAKTEKEVFDLKAESLVDKAEVAMLNERVKQLIIHTNEMEAKAKKELEWSQAKYAKLKMSLLTLVESLD